MTEDLITLEHLRRFRLNLLDKDIPSDQIWRGEEAPPTGTDHILAINYAKGLLYYKNEIGTWNAVATGGGGSGGGTATNNAVFTVTNKSGWMAKTVALGAECNIILEWSSIEDEIPTGNGKVTITVDGTVKSIYEVQQGEVIINVDNYLVLGDNSIIVTISDIYGNKREIYFTITCVKLTLTSDFVSSVAYTGDIKYLYTPTGDVEKTVYFIVDGGEPITQTVYASGREQEFTIPAQSHGNHTLEVYFIGKIDGQDVPSNHLYYDIICYENGNNTPIIACAFNTESVKQYSTVDMSYIVYTPQMLSSEVTITDNFGYSTTRTVDRTLQPFSYKAENVGTTEITFTVGNTTRVISFETLENQIDVYAETSNLELYLASKGRSNNDKETNPLDWSFGDVKAELTGFNLTNDGWQLDNNGDTVLRVTGDSRVYIPFNIFETDFRTNGKTIEFEFATRDVLNYDAVIMSCMSGGRGIEITAQKALLTFEGGEIFTQYKEDEHIRIAFSVDRRSANNENPLVRIYINGIMSGAIKYSGDTDFSQFNPVGISIGSNECTTDIYCIRVYGNGLSQYQILDNWIADTQDIEELIERYNRNNIFDAYGNVAVDKLPTTLPYLVLEAKNYEYLPQYKGDKGRPINGRYVDPLWQSRCFTFYQAQIDVQGTSSQYYSRKNYKIKFKNGFIIDGQTKFTYQLRDTSIPTSTFTFKADVASSEGANNVELCKLYDDVCPVKTPPQKADSRVRQGIEGYPCLIFYYDGNNYYFLGKYNFNNDKGTPEVFGFASGDESWEILQNNTPMVVWKDDDFSTNEWKKSFEARYPEDSTDVTNLQVFATWLKSTDTEVVDTEDEKAERIAKFKNELGNYANVDMLIFNYIFTELFLMVDNRAKNAFPTRYDEDGKWLILPYDYDTAIGINNEGELKYGYELEDTDLINGNYVFNGQDSVLYVNLRLAFADEIMDMYKDLRSQKKLSYEEVEKRFEEHQGAWGEAIFNEDARFKYIDPLVEDGNSTYLPMLQGSKAEQRKWWLYNRFRYIDSKYNAGDSLSDYIMLRGYGVSDIYIKPYADIYATVAFDSVLVQCRALRKNTPDEGYKIETPLSAGNGAVISIYSASQLADVGDLSGLKVGMADFSKGTKLSKLKVGDGAEGYENPNLTDLTIGNLTLLTELDVRNCTNLAQTVDVSGCTNLEHAYFEGTKITGVTLPNGGILKTLHLPSTVTNLTIRNQPLLTDFEMPSYENLTTLRLENLDVDVFDTLSMVLQMPGNSRVRVLGVEWNIETPEEIFEVFDKLDTYRGLDEYGNNVDNPQISGIIHTDTITGDQLAEMKSRYPNFTIDYKHIICRVEFYNYDGELLHTAYVEDNGDCYDPITAELIVTPIRPETDESKFIYSGWDKSLEKVGENRIITALYDEYKKYYISFVDDFGNAVQVNGNDTNIYYDREGENLISVPALPNYSIVDGEGATWDYHFEGWSLDGVNVIDIPTVRGEDYNITYKAVFSEHRVYVVKFMNDDVIHNELHLYEGEGINIPVITPKRVSTYQFDYEFAGWTLDGENIVDVAETIGTEDITYIAKYTAIDRYYAIKFVNWDGEEIKVYSVKHDEVPVYDGENPTKKETAEFFYDFDGWTPEIVAVTGEAVYTATYLATLRTYTVRWLNEDGTSLLEEDVNVPYGTMPSYDGAIPTKQANAQYTYTFAGWHIEISEVTGDMIYKATYTAEVNKYTITWKNENGTVLETDEKVPYGDMPEYNGSTPTKASTVQYDFVFAGWDTAVSEVTGDVVYTAIYTQHIRRYKINWVVGDETKTAEYEYGSIPTPPSGFEIGTSVEYYGSTGEIIGWSPNVSSVVGIATYTAKVECENSLTAYVSNYGMRGGWLFMYPEKAYKNNSGEQWAEQSTSVIEHYGTCQYYGMNFSALNNESDVRVTGFDIFVRAYADLSNKNTILGTHIITDVDKTQSSNYGAETSYTDLGDGAKYWLYDTKVSAEQKNAVVYKLSSDNFPNALKWINDNLNKVVNDGTSGTFGLNMRVWNANFKDLGMTIHYKSKGSIKKTVVFVDMDGTVLSSAQYDYGTPASSIVIPNAPVHEGHNFIGWSSEVSDVTGNVTYIARYEVQKFTVTWKVGNQSKTTECEYDSTPTPPSGFEVGATVVDNGATCTIKSWNISTVTGNMTFTATIGVTGASFSARFTKYTYKGAKGDIDSFLAGTGSYGYNGSMSTAALVHGLNFEALRGLKNLQITGLKVEGQYSHSGNVSSESKLDFGYNLGSSSSSYTSTGDGLVVLASGKNTTVNYCLTEANFPQTFAWIKNNFNSFLNGYNSNSFGAKINSGYYAFLAPITVTIICDYEV